MHKILHIIGARPHFMKLAPIYHRAQEKERWQQVICHTGQHYDFNLSEAFLGEFDLPQPDYNFGIGSGPHLLQIGRMLLKFNNVLSEEKPDIVFVYGDTNSTAAGAIAAAKCNIPLAHIEAGLREHDKSIPEEVNKLLTDAVSDLLFCPTQTAVDNLRNERNEGRVHLVGDVVADLILNTRHRPETSIVDALGLTAGRYYFATCHRAANTDNPANLKAILSALAGLDAEVIFPVHPRTAEAVRAHGLTDLLKSKNVRLIDPVGFWQTQECIRNARAVITDSGGVIKEAYLHQVPCVIIDRQTEWIESVQEGWAQIAGPHCDTIIQMTRKPAQGHVYSAFLGDGNAAERILNTTFTFLAEESHADEMEL